MTPIDAFKQIMTPDLVRQMLETWSSHVGGGYGKLISGPVGDAMMAFLDAKSAAGELPVIEGFEGHSIDLGTAWNALANGSSKDPVDRKYDLWVAARYCATVLTIPAMMDADKKVQAGETIEAVVPSLHDQIIKAVEKGEARYWSYGSEQLYCATEGRFYSPDMQGWRLMFGSRGGGRELEPIQPVIRPLIEGKITFDVGSGDLLIADTFRIPGIWDLVYPKGGKNDTSSAVGRRADAIRCLKKFGFLNIPVGNTSPSIYRDGDQILFGTEGFVEGSDEDSMDRIEEPNLDKVGDVITDRWSVMVFPREKLVELAARVVGADKAEAAVQDALASPYCHYVNLKVEPGKRIVYFNGNTERFNEEFYSPDLNVSPSFIPYIVLSTKKLKLEEKPEVAPAPGMGGPR